MTLKGRASVSWVKFLAVLPSGELLLTGLDWALVNVSLWMVKVWWHQFCFTWLWLSGSDIVVVTLVAILPMGMPVAIWLMNWTCCL